MRLLLLLFVLCCSPELFAQSSWRKLQSPRDEHLTAVQFFDADRGYVIGRSGAFLSTTDGGKKWVERSITTSHPFAYIEALEMHFFDPMKGVVGGSLDTLNGLVPDPRPTLFWTYDGGETWDAQMFDEAGAIARIQFLDPKFAYFVSSESQGFGRSSVYYTNGGGFRTELWQKRTSYPSPQRARGMAFKDNVMGIISGDDEFVIPGNLYLTEDEGNSWSTFIGEESGSSSSFDALHWTLDGLIATSGSRIMHSLDNGHTWGTVATAAGSAYYNGFTFTDDKIGFAVPLFSGQVLKTTDGGFSWQMQQIPEAGIITDMWAVEPDIAYAVGAAGGVYKLSEHASVDRRNAQSHVSVYPNPARSFLMIESALADHDRQGYIYDGLGRTALTFRVSRDGTTHLDVQKLVPGGYTVVIDGQATTLMIQP